jgi:hypothetical protein
MTRRFDRYITTEQAARILKVEIHQVLEMVNSGQFRKPQNGPGRVQLINATAVELARRRLESLRALDGDVQQ